MSRFFLACLTVFLLPSLGNATLIVNISGPSSPPGVTPLPSTWVNADNTNIGAVGTSVNTVNLNVAIDDSYIFGTPFDWSFALADTNQPSQLGSEFFVTVNFTNNGFAPVGPVQFDLVTFGGIFEAGTNLNFDTSGLGAFDPTPAAAGYTFIGAHDPTRLVFGGLNGSGGAVPPFGGTTAFTFSIDAEDIIPIGGVAGTTTGNFTLRMVVNPEPTSLLLGLSSVGFFTGAIYKRRKRAIVSQAV